MLRRKISLPILVLVLCFSICKQVQSQNIDSLRNVLPALSNAKKIEAYLKIGNLFSENYGKPDSLLKYSGLAYKISKEAGNLKGENLSRLNIAIAYQKTGKVDTSILILNSLLEKIKNSTENDLIGDVRFNLGLNYRFINDFNQATTYYLKAIDSYEKSKNYGGRALSNVRLAGIFTLQSQVDVALIYARKANLLLPKITDPVVKISTLSGLSALYSRAINQNKLMADTSIYYAKQALELSDKSQLFTKGNQLCLTISNGYFLIKDYKSALEYCKRSMNYRNYLFKYEIINSYEQFGNCYFKLKEYPLSIAYLDSAKKIAVEMKDAVYEMAIEMSMYEHNKEAGKYKEAMTGLERVKILNDSLYNMEKSQAINELEQKYNKSENEKQINELNRQKEIADLNVKFLAVGILASVLIILVIIFFYRQSVLKNKFKVLETEQRLNRARMDPHFFFNALSSIQTLSMDKENSSSVSSLISKFSKIMRQSLESTYDELTTIEEEVSFLSNYLDIQKLRYNNKFDYKIVVDDKLEVDELKILGMLLQPFIENSIEHGFKNIDYKGELKISFIKEEAGLKVELRDNGKGFETDKLQKEYPSRATQIIGDRLLLLNKKQKSHAGYKLSQNPDGKGIMVEVHLPFIC